MCLFCQIVKKELTAKILFEDEYLVAFSDNHPQAPTHALIVPRRHLVSLNDAEPADAELLGRLLLGAKRVAREANISDSGWRVVINNGAHAGQSVFHVHVHVLGGRSMTWPPG